jgi:hypothetical protein
LRRPAYPAPPTVVAGVDDAAAGFGGGVAVAVVVVGDGTDEGG